MSYQCKAVPTGHDVVWLKTVVDIDSTTKMPASGKFGTRKIEWPKGTITWNRCDPAREGWNSYAEAVIAIAEGRKDFGHGFGQNIHPEANRHSANMPVELFELLYNSPRDYTKGTKVMAIRDCISGDSAGPDPRGHKVKRGEVLIITDEGEPGTRRRLACFWFAKTPGGAGHFLPKDFIIIGTPGQYATEIAAVTKKRAATKKSTTSDAIKPANEVQVGDTVRIIKSRSNWNKKMDEYVGREVVVTKVSSSGSGDVIEFAGSGNWAWCSANKHYIVIKNAQPTQMYHATKHPASGIVPADQVQVGDIVRITESDDNWTGQMDKYVGREVVVTAVHPAPEYVGVRILFSGSSPWSWTSRDRHYIVISRPISDPCSGGVSGRIPGMHIDTPTKPEGSPIRISTSTINPIKIKHIKPVKAVKHSRICI